MWPTVRSFGMYTVSLAFVLFSTILPVMAYIPARESNDSSSIGVKLDHRHTGVSTGLVLGHESHDRVRAAGLPEQWDQPGGSSHNYKICRSVSVTVRGTVFAHHCPYPGRATGTLLRGQPAK